MQHMLHDNIGLCFIRQFSGEGQYSHVLVSKEIVDNRTFFSSKGIIQQAPLYLYKTKSKRKSQTMMLFEPETAYDNKGRIPNISLAVIEKLEKAYKKKFGSKDLTPEHILHYCYAILYSNICREKYVEFLKIDFPRIPFTGEYKLFIELAKVGEELTELHLLEHKALNKPVAKYKGKGDDQVKKPKYDEEKHIVFINEKNYFEGITPEVWNYYVGGYQVMEKYLKDRKGRAMDDPGHYCKIATSLSLTIELQLIADNLYKKIEKKVIS